MTQLHPVPAAAVAVSPAGTGTVTVTGWSVGPAVLASATPTVIVPEPPWAKSPLSATVVTRLGRRVVMVRPLISWIAAAAPVDAAKPNLKVEGNGGWFTEPSFSEPRSSGPSTFFPPR